MHLPTMRVTAADGDVELSRSEFEPLGFLLRRLDRVVTRRTLEEQELRGGSDNVGNVLDVHMSSLRRKIGEGDIRTVRGVGHVIDQQPPKRGARP